MMRLAILALIAWLPLAWAQTPPNVTPRAPSWWNEAVEVDIRLKGQPTATNPAGPTVRLISAAKFNDANAKIYDYTYPCWNTAGACPAVHGVAFRVFLRLPGGARQNVTVLTGACGFTATECITPWFVPITAKPGEGYNLRYNRVNATWEETPKIVALLPDLIIVDLNYAANGIFSSVIKNQGSAPTTPGAHIGVAYSVDGVYRTWGMSVNSLAPGGSVYIASDGGPYVIPPGAHTISAWVDDANRFTELDETNNGRSLQISVGN